MNKKYIIGIGDSWTHGEGAWPEHILEKYEYKVQYYKHRNPVDLPLEEYQELESIERANGWLSQLCNHFLTDYEPINLGMPGRGNHSAVRNLRFLDPTLDLSESIIILMLTTPQRFDMFVDSDARWFTGHPQEPDSTHENLEQCFGAAYTCFSYGVNNSCHINTLLDMLELQDFANLRGAKFLVCNGFNQECIKEFTQESNIHNAFDWSKWAHTYTHYNSFMDLLLEKENFNHDEHKYAWYHYFQRMSKPSTYITNCLGSHPTIEGHKLIAEELAKLINTNNKT